MNNQIFNAMMQSTPIGNVKNLLSQYRQFRKTLQGDPQQKIQEMLNSGQITQEQVNRARNMATQFKGILK